MPSVKTHCKNSKDRTDKDFKELHEWMDKPGEILGIDHRRVRHDLSYINDVRKKFEKEFGVEVVKEFLKHIAEDYEYSSEKWGNVCATEGCDNRTWHKNKFCNSCKKLKKNEY